MAEYRITDVTIEYLEVTHFIIRDHDGSASVLLYEGGHWCVGMKYRSVLNYLRETFSGYLSWPSDYGTS